MRRKHHEADTQKIPGPAAGGGPAGLPLPYPGGGGRGELSVDPRLTWADQDYGGDYALEGAGTPQSPYLIRSSTDWAFLQTG